MGKPLLKDDTDFRHLSSSSLIPISEGALRVWLKSEFEKITTAHKSCNIFQSWDISWHSLRKGGAVFAYLQGIPLDIMKCMGRWQSDAINIYVTSIQTSIMGPQAMHKGWNHTAESSLRTRLTAYVANDLAIYDSHLCYPLPVCNYLEDSLPLRYLQSGESEPQSSHPAVITAPSGISRSLQELLVDINPHLLELCDTLPIEKDVESTTKNPKPHKSNTRTMCTCGKTWSHACCFALPKLCATCCIQSLKGACRASQHWIACATCPTQDTKDIPKGDFRCAQLLCQQCCRAQREDPNFTCTVKGHYPERRKIPSNSADDN